MDMCSSETLVDPPQLKGQRATPRRPLGLSEKSNVVPPVRRPPREVDSRYLSGITSNTNSTSLPPRRCSSPAARGDSTLKGSLPKRSHSAERRNPSICFSRSSASSSPCDMPSRAPSPSSRSTTPVHNYAVEMQKRVLDVRTPDGLWPSMRSLATSFQSDSTIMPVSRRDRVVVNSSVDHSPDSSINKVIERKRTPLRGRSSSDHLEKSRPVERPHLKLVDQGMRTGMTGRKVISSSLSTNTDLTNKASQTTFQISSRGISPRKTHVSGVPQQSTSEVVVRKISCDVNVRGERDIALGVNAQTPPHPSERALLKTQPIRTLSSPIWGFPRFPAPSRSSSMPSCTSKGMQSPSRTRPSNPFTSSSSTTGRATAAPSNLHCSADARTGKKSANHADEVHQLRLLHNKDLQWRFVNAQAAGALFIQKMRAKNSLHNVWNTVADLREAVVLNRISVQHLRGCVKLDIILKEQISYLEECAALDLEHGISLSGAIDALKASTLRLPVTGGARADTRALKNAVRSSVDVMQAISSSICYLLAKIEGITVLVSELLAVAEQERAMLDEYRELLASTAAMQVHEASLRTHLMQLNQSEFGALSNHLS